MSLNESTAEDTALEWFGGLGCAIGHGPDMATGEPVAERDSFGDAVLLGRSREAIRRLNPAIPEEASAIDRESLSVQNTSKSGMNP